MAIMLGNLSVEQIEKRSGVQFPDELKEMMNETRQERASHIEKGKWHCFDMPFQIVCGDREIATKIYEHLAPLTKQFKVPLRIALESGAE